jgi:hypothetical protein
MLSVLAAVLVCFAADDKKPADADPKKGVVVKASDLDEFAAKVGDLTLNNLSLKETPDEEDKAIAEFRVTGNLKNKAGENRKATVMIVGLDEAKVPVWSVTQTLNASGMESATLEETLRLPAGARKATASVWVRLVPQK